MPPPRPARHGDRTVVIVILVALACVVLSVVLVEVLAPRPVEQVQFVAAALPSAALSRSRHITSRR